MNPRPRAITWLCVWEFLGVVGIVALAITLYFSDIRAQVSYELGPQTLEMLVVACLLQPLRLTGLVGLWQMRYWGIFLYGGYLFATAVLWLYGMTQGITDMLNGISYFISLILLLVAVTHRRTFRL